jgi:hypothetical protein
MTGTRTALVATDGANFLRQKSRVDRVCFNNEWQYRHSIVPVPVPGVTASPTAPRLGPARHGRKPLASRRPETNKGALVGFNVRANRGTAADPTHHGRRWFASLGWWCLALALLLGDWRPQGNECAHAAWAEEHRAGQAAGAPNATASWFGSNQPVHAHRGFFGSSDSRSDRLVS